MVLIAASIAWGVGCSGDDAVSSDASGSGGEAVLVVRGDGIAVLDGGATSTTMFGTIEGDVVAEVGSVLGEPIETGRDRACSPTAQVVRYRGITVSLSDGIFVGWTLRPDAADAIATPEGVGPGSTLAELEAAFDVVTVDPTSDLGVEFVADGAIFGLLDGTGPDATIETLWAGQTCDMG